MFGIDFSVTKHVMMLWVVALIVFLLVTVSVRRYLKQDRLVPSGFMNFLEFGVEFVRDSIVEPNVGKKWVKTWAPLLLTFFIFILSANAIGLIPIFEVLGLVNLLFHNEFICSKVEIQPGQVLAPVLRSVLQQPASELGAVERSIYVE